MSSANLRAQAVRATQWLIERIDGRRGSATLGCADPAFWRERSRSFASGPAQGAALPLALVCTAEAPPDLKIGERSREELRDLALAALRCGIKLISADGSIPGRCADERSPLSTALAAAPLFEAACLLHEHLDGELSAALERGSASCAAFLARFDEPFPSAFARLLSAWAVDRAAKIGRRPGLHLKARDMLARALEPAAAEDVGLIEGDGQDPALTAACLGLLARFGQGEPLPDQRRRAATLAARVLRSQLPGTAPLGGGLGSAYGGLLLPFGLSALGARVGHDHGLDDPASWHGAAAAWICADLWHAVLRGQGSAEPTDDAIPLPFGLARMDVGPAVLLANPERGLAFALCRDAAGAILDEGVTIRLAGGACYASGLPDPSLRYRLGERSWECRGATKLLRDPRLGAPLPRLLRWQTDLAFQLHCRRIARLLGPPAAPLEFRRELRADGPDLICIDELRYDLDHPIDAISLGGPLPFVERLLGRPPATPSVGAASVPPEDLRRLQRSGRLKAVRVLGPEGLRAVSFE